MPHKRLSAAKINLFLHILGKRADGYHKLESLVTFANIGDQLSYIANDDALSLNIKGPYAHALKQFKLEDNLVLKAARKLEQHFNITMHGILTLEKNLPIASGIGGGSANAATAIKLLVQHYNLPIQALDEILLELGADIPVCFNQKTTIMSGIGENLDDWPTLPKINAILVNPNISVSTAKIFAKLNASSNLKHEQFANQVKPEINDFEQLVDFLGNQQNDMQQAAVNLCPQIGDILDQLNANQKCMFAQMSGSGATCFGLYKNANDATNAAKILTNSYPDYWVQTCILG